MLVVSANSQVYNMSNINSFELVPSTMARPLSVNERFEKIEKEIWELTNIIKQLQTDIKDFNEAFEHSDDSLQRLRTTVFDITGNHNEGN